MIISAILTTNGLNSIPCDTRAPVGGAGPTKALETKWETDSLSSYNRGLKNFYYKREMEVGRREYSCGNYTCIFVFQLLAFLEMLTQCLYYNTAFCTKTTSRGTSWTPNQTWPFTPPGQQKRSTQRFQTWITQTHSVRI